MIIQVCSQCHAPQHPASHPSLSAAQAFVPACQWGCAGRNPGAHHPRPSPQGCRCSGWQTAALADLENLRELHKIANCRCIFPNVCYVSLSFISNIYQNWTKDLKMQPQFSVDWSNKNELHIRRQSELFRVFVLHGHWPKAYMFCQWGNSGDEVAFMHSSGSTSQSLSISLSVDIGVPP